MCSALDKPIHQCSDVGVIATTATKLLAATAGFCAMKRTFDVERSCLSGVIGIGLVLAEKKHHNPTQYIHMMKLHIKAMKENIPNKSLIGPIFQ